MDDKAAPRPIVLKGHLSEFSTRKALAVLWWRARFGEIPIVGMRRGINMPQPAFIARDVAASVALAVLTIIVFGVFG